jgi:hypothetical protein
MSRDRGGFFSPLTVFIFDCDGFYFSTPLTPAPLPCPALTPRECESSLRVLPRKVYKYGY